MNRHLRHGRNGGLPLAAASLLAVLAACGGDAAVDSASGPDESEVVTNRIAIPPIVRNNLGITFATVERRRVADTIRVPGVFELEADARVEYRAPVAGRVRMLASRYDAVEAGAPLYRLDAPEWIALRQDLAEAEVSGAFAERSLAASAARVEAERAKIEELESRLAQLDALRAAGGGRATELAEARGSLAHARAELAAAEEERARAELESIRLRERSDSRRPNSRFAQALAQASSWTGLSEEELLAPARGEGGDAPRWKTLAAIESHAVAPGRVETVRVATGAWVQAGDLVAATVDPARLVFRAKGLQSDLGLLRDGAPASIVPPQGGSIGLQNAMESEMRFGLEADPRERTVDLLLYPKALADWARPGVAAFAEVVADETASPETAIPLSCVVTDGTEKAIFLRDRADPDKAIRMAADLGVSDGRWVVVRSGVKAGDEVVLGGAYELKLTGGGKAAQGGHFHSDGTFHEAHD